MSPTSYHKITKVIFFSIFTVLFPIQDGWQGKAPGHVCILTYQFQKRIQLMAHSGTLSPKTWMTEPKWP